MEVKILMNPFSKKLLLLERTNAEMMAQQLRVNTACTEDPVSGDQHFWPPQAPTHMHTSLKREKNETGLKDLFQTFSLVFTTFFQTKLQTTFLLISSTVLPDCPLTFQESLSVVPLFLFFLKFTHNSSKSIIQLQQIVLLTFQHRL